MVILGIDPGSVRIGYGAIKKEKGKLIHLESGLLKLPRQSHEKRLAALEKNLKMLVRRLKPDRIGLEKLFFVKNQKTALGVAEARGVILSVIAKRVIPFSEITPAAVKLAVTGNGRADKKAVGEMVNLFLGLRPRKRIDDVSDALAIAIAVSNRPLT